MGELVSDRHMTPQFSENRDLSDEPYECGWRDGKAGRPHAGMRYQRRSHQKAYGLGYYAATQQRGSM